MANSASDARASEQELRRQLIANWGVDVMVAVGPNMFYTVTLPCTLWFLDKGKAANSRKDTVLFIDARHIYRQIDRAHRDWTSAQIGLIANIVRLYRGEEPDFTLGGDQACSKLKFDSRGFLISTTRVTYDAPSTRASPFHNRFHNMRSFEHMFI